MVVVVYQCHRDTSLDRAVRRVGGKKTGIEINAPGWYEAPGRAVLVAA